MTWLMCKKEDFKQYCNIGNWVETLFAVQLNEGYMFLLLIFIDQPQEIAEKHFHVLKTTKSNDNSVNHFW